jgi:hypothetical protein
MKMDIVIPLLEGGSQWDNRELCYTLRSICKYVPHRDVYILGPKVDWLKGVNYVNAYDQPGDEWKEANIMYKISLACQIPALSEKFIFFNDDHFILKRMSSLPYYYSGTLWDYLANKGTDSNYCRTVANTARVLKNSAIPQDFYDIHAPIVYNKKDFCEVMGYYDWTQPYGYVIKSLYCNTLGIKGTAYTDLKIKERFDCKKLDRLTQDRKFFSIGDGAIGLELDTFLNYLYPKPSKYELL